MSFSASMHDPFSPFDKFSAKHPREPFCRWHEPEICRVSQFARSFLYLKERRQSTTLNLKCVCIRNLVCVLSLCFTPVWSMQSQRSPAARALKLMLFGVYALGRLSSKTLTMWKCCGFLWWLVNWCYKLKGVTTTLRVWEAKWNHVMFCLSSPQKNP